MKNFPQGLKPQSVYAFYIRLKPVPFTKNQVTAKFSQHLVVDAGQGCIGCCTAPADAQVLHAMQCECPIRARGAVTAKKSAAPLQSGKTRGAHRSRVRNLHVAHLTLRMCRMKKPDAGIAPTSRFRILVLVLRRLHLCGLGRGAATVSI